MSRTTNNTLNHREMFNLTNIVQGLFGTNTTFTKWEEAEDFFTKRLGRKVTRNNIRTACETLGRDVTEIVKIDLESNPYAQLQQVVRTLRLRVDQLEARIATLESGKQNDGSLFS